MSLIIGPLEQVMKSHRISEEDGEYLVVINKITTDFIRWSNQLLDFRKIDFEQIQTPLRYCDVGQLVREQLAMFGPTAQQRRIRLIGRDP